MARCRKTERRWRRCPAWAKTANVVLNTAFGWPTIAVDTTSSASAIGRSSPKNVEQVEEASKGPRRV